MGVWYVVWLFFVGVVVGVVLVYYYDFWCCYYGVCVCLVFVDFYVDYGVVCCCVFFFVCDVGVCW